MTIHNASVAEDEGRGNAMQPRPGARHIRRSQADPALVGVLLLNAQLRPVYHNAEATRILGYPDKVRHAPSLNDVLAIAPKIAELADPGLPQEIKFKSGRRQYVCRSFVLDAKRGADRRLQPRFVVMIERETSPLVDLERWGDEFQLTNRERQAVGLLVKGLTSKQIAARMSISPNTVKSFLKLVMIKVGATNRTGIVAKLFERAS